VGTPKELRLPRWALGRLIMARTRHGDFVEYHERFNHVSYQPWCGCGKEKTPAHFISCKEALKIWKSEDRRKVPKPPCGGLSRKIDWVLGTPKGGRYLQAYMEATKFHTNICPIGWTPRGRR